MYMSRYSYIISNTELWTKSHNSDRHILTTIVKDGANLAVGREFCDIFFSCCYFFPAGLSAYGNYYWIAHSLSQLRFKNILSIIIDTGGVVNNHLATESLIFGVIRQIVNEKSRGKFDHESETQYCLFLLQHDFVHWYVAAALHQLILFCPDQYVKGQSTYQKCAQLSASISC